MKVREFKSSKPASNNKKKQFRKREPEKCRFCRDKVDEIDYKDMNVLQRMVTSQGKHFSRKRTGNCAIHQRLSCQALKHARFVALLPFCG